MFLCAAFDRIPEDIPCLSENAADKAIPRRFCDRGMRDALDRLWAEAAGGHNALLPGEGGWGGEETEEEQESGERGWVRAPI